MDVGILGGGGAVIPFHNSGFTGSVIEEVEGVIAVGQVSDLFTVEGVVRGASGGGDFLDSQAAGVVLVDNGFGGPALCLQLPALLPGVQPFPVAGGIADFVVSNIRAVEFRQLILPVGVGVGVGDDFQSSSRQGTHGVGVTLLVQNVAATIICIRPGGAILTGSQIILVVHPDQLAEEYYYYLCEFGACPTPYRAGQALQFLFSILCHAT